MHPLQDERRDFLNKYLIVVGGDGPNLDVQRKSQAGLDLAVREQRQGENKSSLNRSNGMEGLWLGGHHREIIAYSRTLMVSE